MLLKHHIPYIMTMARESHPQTTNISIHREAPLKNDI